MQVDEKQMVTFFQLEQGYTDEREAFEIEVSLQFLRDEVLEPLLPGSSGVVVQMHRADSDPVWRVYYLPRFTLNNGKCGSQRCMTADDPIETLLQSNVINGAAETVSDRHIVCKCPWGHPVKEPNLQLGERKRYQTCHGILL